MFLIRPGSLYKTLHYTMYSVFAFHAFSSVNISYCIQQGGAQQGDQCTDTQADHALKVAILPT